MYFNRRRAYHSRAKALIEARGRYPYRLVRDHQPTPKPEDVNIAEFGHFAKFPSPDGDEWMFMTRDALERFHARFGGTILGE